MSPRVTMRDLARALGVSSMTVSRALRDDKTVSEDTRTRVRRAADELGYVYDSTAQAFRTQKSGFVAVTLPSLNNANFADTYRSLLNGIAGAGMQLLLGATNYRPEKEEELVRQLLARNPEALVMTGGHHTQATRQLVAARGIPVIEMWDLPSEPLGHAIGFSNAAAMERIVDHLVATGRRKLAFVGASAGADHRGADRRDGVIAAARARGLPEVAVLDAGPAPVSMRHSAPLIEGMGQAVLAYDALVCVSDPVAFGVLSACRRLGIRVPGQLAITGFGNFEIASVSEPRITTVDVHAARIGEEAARLLTLVARTETPPKVVDLGSHLVPGDTA